MIQIFLQLSSRYSEAQLEQTILEQLRFIFAQLLAILAPILTALHQYQTAISVIKKTAILAIRPSQSLTTEGLIESRPQTQMRAKMKEFSQIISFNQTTIN